jgi:hypothetical protein
LAVTGLPTFYTCDSEVPRFAALADGVVLSLVVFLLLFITIGRGGETRRSSAYFDSVFSRPLSPARRLLLSSPLLAARRLLSQPVKPASGIVTKKLLAQFDKYDVVALGEWHGRQEDVDLRMRLIGDPDFAKKVHDIVVEFGNSLYQGDLDRYIKGENVPETELRRIWRDTTQSPVMSSGSISNACPPLLSEVRSLNKHLPDAQKIRVIAGDPPIDWAKVKTTEEFAEFLNRRDEVPAELIAQEVLRRGEKALVVYGAGHIWRGNEFVKTPNLVSLLDGNFPGRIYAVFRVGGVYPETDKLESLIDNPARPIFLPLKGTAIGALDANDFIGRDIPVRLFPAHLQLAQVADALVYSGRNADSMIKEGGSGQGDPTFAQELARRKRLMPAPRR